MSKVRVTIGSTYCGCPSEEIEFEYDGTESEFNRDHIVSTDILNMILNGDFEHYFLDIDFIEGNEEEEND